MKVVFPFRSGMCYSFLSCFLWQLKHEWFDVLESWLNPSLARTHTRAHTHTHILKQWCIFCLLPKLLYFATLIVLKLKAHVTLLLFFFSLFHWHRSAPSSHIRPTFMWTKWRRDKWTITFHPPCLLFNNHAVPPCKICGGPSCIPAIWGAFRRTPS